MLKVFKQNWGHGWNNVRTTLFVSMLLSVVVGVVLGLLGNAPVVSVNAIGFFGEGAVDKVLAGLMIVWFAVMTALLVQTIVAIVYNLNESMFGKEACLTHSLPVESWELLGGKALGTWAFGVFMVLMALVDLFLLMFSAAAGTGEMGEFLLKIVKVLPKLGAFHIERMAAGIGYLLYGFGAFLIWSLMLVILLQFIFIAARQFGKYHLAGGVIVFVVLLEIGGRLNKAISAGFIVVLLLSAACFTAGNWLLKNRLSL